MPQCEMCGKKVEILKDAIVEGTFLSVCDPCLEYGKPVIVDKPKIIDESMVQREITLQEPEEIEIIIHEAGEIIKKERERRKLKQDELAKLLAEKASTLSAIESGRSHLPLKIAKKLEQFLNVKLTAKHTEGETPKKLDISDPDLTIGDLIRSKSRKA